MNKLKMLAFVALLAQLCFAQEPKFKEFWKNNGTMSPSSLILSKCEYSICASGEITLTGVLENAEFFPDKNLNLPFLYNTFDMVGVDDKGNLYDTKEKDLSKVKFQRLDFALSLDISKAKLPQSFKSIRGVAGMRVEVRIKDYSFVGEGEAGRSANAVLVSVKPLSEVKFAYFSVENMSRCLEYNSKDDYINIREKPKGNVVGQILAKDKAKSFIYGFDANSAGWHEILYFPPNVKNSKDAISGFVHKSQLKYICEDVD